MRVFSHIKRAHALRCLLSTSDKVECCLPLYFSRVSITHARKLRWVELSKIGSSILRRLQDSAFLTVYLPILKRKCMWVIQYFLKIRKFLGTVECLWLSSFQGRRGQPGLLHHILWAETRGEHSRKVLHWGRWRLSVFMPPIPWSPKWSVLCISQAKPFTSKGFVFSWE